MMTMISKNRVCPVCAEKEIRKLNIVNDIEIVRCLKCKMVFADVENSVIEDKNIYTEKMFYKYIAHEPIYTLAYYDLILEKIQKHFDRKNFKILEFGCGPGFFLRRAKLKNIDAYGCDFSEYSQLAKDIFKLNIKIDNIFDADYQNNEFDVIITHATHEHLGNMSEISKKLYDLLKPGGLYIISGVPNYNTIPIKVFRNFFKNEPPSHVNFFEKKTIDNLYNKLNLKVLFKRTYGASTWVWAFMIRLKQIFAKNKTQHKKTPTISTEKKIEPKITKLHRIIANIYINFHIYSMGRHIEIWGKKMK